MFALFTEKSWGWNRRPHRLCIDCHRKKRKGPVPHPTKTVSEAGITAELPLSQIAGISVPTPDHKGHAKKQPSAGTILLDHHVFTKAGWRRTRFKDHPKVQLTVSLDDQLPRYCSTPNLSTPVHATVDSDDCSSFRPVNRTCVPNR